MTNEEKKQADLRESVRKALEEGVAHPEVQKVYDGGRQVVVLLENGRWMKFRCVPILRGGSS